MIKTCTSYIAFSVTFQWFVVWVWSLASLSLTVAPVSYFVVRLCLPQAHDPTARSMPTGCGSMCELDVVICPLSSSSDFFITRRGTLAESWAELGRFQLNQVLSPRNSRIIVCIYIPFWHPISSLAMSTHNTEAVKPSRAQSPISLIRSIFLALQLSSYSSSPSS